MRGYLTRGEKSPVYRHGLSHTKVWNTWKDMWKRCTDPQARGYHRYGGRGIMVDPTWSDVAVFHAHVGDPPSPKHTLDRIDNDGPYAPGNVRWATRRTQAINSSRARMLTFEGRTQTMMEWSRELGIPYTRLQSRINRGWDVGRAFFAR
jgi:hypothetical protein